MAVLTADPTLAASAPLLMRAATAAVLNPLAPLADLPAPALLARRVLPPRALSAADLPALPTPPAPARSALPTLLPLDPASLASSPSDRRPTLLLPASRP